MACRVRELLEMVYKNANLSAEEKESKKIKIFKKYKNEILGTNKEWCYYKKINFASLYVNYLYNKHKKPFYDFFRSFGDLREVDLRVILERIKTIARRSDSSNDFIRAIKRYTDRNYKKLRK